MFRWLDNLSTRALIVIGLLVVLFNLVDGITTAYIVNHSGSESNLLVRRVIDQIGAVNAMIMVKAIAVPCVIFLVRSALAGSNLLLARFCLFFAFAIYGVLAIYHVAMVFVTIGS